MPASHAPGGRRVLPWTDGLPEFFRERRGYDLLAVLPWLFYDGEGAAKARHDYWYTVSQRFTEAYSKQLGEWCEKHGLAFTGHYLNEAEMGHGTLRGGAIMPHYRYQQVPGIDMLTEQNREFLTIKQCTQRGQPVRPGARPLRDLRLLGLGVYLRGSEVERRLAVRVGGQPALPAPGALHRCAAAASAITRPRSITTPPGGSTTGWSRITSLASGG